MGGTTIGTRLFVVVLAGLALFGTQAGLELSSQRDQLRAEARDQAQLLAQIAAGEISDALDIGDFAFGEDLDSPEAVCAFVEPFAAGVTAIIRGHDGTEQCRFGDDERIAGMANPTAEEALGPDHVFGLSDAGWQLSSTLSTPGADIVFGVEMDGLAPSGLLAERDDIEVLLVVGARIFGTWPTGSTEMGTRISSTRLPPDLLSSPTDGSGLDGTSRIFATEAIPGTDGVVVVGLDDHEVAQALSSSRTDVLLTLGLGALAMLLIVLMVSRSIAEPIRRFANGLRVHGVTGIPALSRTGPREVRELVDRFNQLAGEANRSTERLEFLAHSDLLTGLYNRVRVTELLSQMLQTVDANATIAVLHADLDDFTGVNQAYGSDVGDRFLRELGNRLRTLGQEDLTVGRLQGDEFIVFGVTPVRSVAKLARRVLATLTQPVVVEGIVIECAATVGVTVAARGADVADVLAQAGRALDEAKRTSADSYVHDEALRERTIEWARMANDLRDALEHDEIDVAFQAIASTEDGRVTGVEALARWTHTVDGPIPPGVFVPVAERSGVIDALGLAVLRRSCAVVAQWHREVPDIAPSVSVNVSARQLASRDLPEVVSRVLRETGLPPASLALEVTESMILADFDAMVDRLNLIRGIGVRVSLDDFGTGYSSLSYLTELPVDVLKIDQTFIRNVETDPRARAVLGIIADLGHAVGLTVVCEGVETQGQLEATRAVGADFVQGYVWHRPDTDTDKVLDHIRHSALEASRTTSA